MLPMSASDPNGGCAATTGRNCGPAPLSGMDSYNYPPPRFHSIAPSAPAWGWRDLAGVGLVVVIGGALLVLALRFVIQVFGLAGGDGLAAPAAYLLTAGIYLLMILGIYLFAARRAGWAALGLRAPGWLNMALVLPLFFVGMFMLISVNLVIMLIMGEFENPQIEAITGGQALSPATLAALLLLVAGLVPFAEELLFRGMLYPLLRARMGVAAAIALNAALFALVHIVPILLPALFVVGLLMAYLRERSGSIWPSVAFHMLQNGLALVAIAAQLGG